MPITSTRDRPYPKLLSVVSSLESLCMGIAMASFGLLIVTVCIGVVERAFGLRILGGSVDYSRFLLVAIGGLSLAQTQRFHEHVDVSLLVSVAPPKFRRGLEVTALGVSTLTVTVLSYVASSAASLSLVGGERTIGSVSVAVWPARTALAVGLWVLAFRLFVDFLRRISRSDPNSLCD